MLSAAGTRLLRPNFPQTAPSKLFRRIWQPISLSTALPKPGSPIQAGKEWSCAQN